MRALSLLNAPDVLPFHQAAIAAAQAVAAQNAKPDGSTEATVDIYKVLLVAGYVWSGVDWIKGSMRISITMWGKDHWATLLFLETVCVDDKGKFDPRRMRTFSYGDKKHYHTRLRDGSEYDDERHDDWACLDDMVTEGLLTAPEWGEFYGRRTSNITVALTDYGWECAGLLRRNRAEGKLDRDFVPPVHYAHRFAEPNIAEAVRILLDVNTRYDLPELLFDRALTDDQSLADTTLLRAAFAALADFATLHAIIPINPEAK